jgi:hypothetical protein
MYASYTIFIKTKIFGYLLVDYKPYKYILYTYYSYFIYEEKEEIRFKY